MDYSKCLNKPNQISKQFTNHMFRTLNILPATANFKHKKHIKRVALECKWVKSTKIHFDANVNIHKMQCTCLQSLFDGHVTYNFVRLCIMFNAERRVFRVVKINENVLANIALQIETAIKATLKWVQTAYVVLVEASIAVNLERSLVDFVLIVLELPYVALIVFC